MRKIVLLTAFGAESIYGGGAIVREIIPQLLSNNSITWYNKSYIRPKDDSFINLENLHFQKLFTFRLPSRLKILIQFVEYKLLPYIWLYQLKKRIAKNDRIWIVLENEMIPLARLIFKKFGNDIHISVHDDCRLLSYNHPFYSLSLISKHLRHILKSAKTIDVIGLSLQGEYQKNYNVDSFIFRRGMPSDSNLSFKGPVAKKEYSIIYAGNSGNKQILEKILRYIDLNFEQSFNIHVYGNFSHFENLSGNWGKIEIVNEGVNSEVELIKIASNFDFALFYWDSENIISEIPSHIFTSVSTKLTTYLKMKLPIIAWTHERCDVAVKDLFNYGVGFDLKTGNNLTFKSWIKNDFTEENYQAYINKHFNQDNMNSQFLSRFN